MNSSRRFEVLSPARVDLAGGTLDLWPLYCFTSGARTINCAISLRNRVRFEVREKGPFEATFSLGTARAKLQAPVEREALGAHPEYLRFPIFVLSSFLTDFPALPPQQIAMEFHSELPLRSGLGGSSSLCVALYRGLCHAFGVSTSTGWQWSALEWVKNVEAAFLRTATGTQDYLAPLFGGLRGYEYRASGVTEKAYARSAFEGFKDRLLVLFSGEMHHSGLTNWEIFKGTLEGNAELLKGLQRIRTITESVHTELLSAHVDWRKLGTLLSEEWAVRQKIFKVSTPRLDEILAFLKKQGILGGRVCGAAAGGSFLVLVEPDRKAALEEACRAQSIQVLSAQATTAAVEIQPL